MSSSHATTACAISWKESSSNLATHRLSIAARILRFLKLCLEGFASITHGQSKVKRPLDGRSPAMNVFSAAVAIVAIIGIVSLGRSWVESRQRNVKLEASVDEALTELRERIETLERIVTDQRETLRR